MKATFVKSSTHYKDCPPANMPEYAFIGRSNVGKSSLINMLVQQKDLAKTSQTPGKTQLINHFMIDEAWYLVDLPGYGFAKVSKTARAKWDKMIKEYITNRTNLNGVFLLVDSRHTPQAIDMAFMEWLGTHEVPFVMIFTKMDKLSQTKLQNGLAVYEQQMLQTWEQMPFYFLTSAEKKLGRDEILQFISELNQNYKP